MQNAHALAKVLIDYICFNMNVDGTDRQRAKRSCIPRQRLKYEVRLINSDSDKEVAILKGRGSG